IWYFGAISPSAYPLAYLRIDPNVAVDAARLATDRLAGLGSDGTLTRWTALPNFLAIALPFPFGPAFPGRTDGHTDVERRPSLRRRMPGNPGSCGVRCGISIAPSDAR